MAERKRESFTPPALGGSSLLVVFAVLALTVFALLSLSTVRADARLGDASSEAVRGYYAADCQAQEILARLRSGETPEGVDAQPEESSIWTSRCTYAVPISDTQELQAEVLVNSVDGSYSILRWQAVPVGEWSPDDSLNVWDGIS
ncbi:MAG: hypothetical protein HFF18_09270 [Oscillospiraceae bacterium]|nr:hypothetical protein [Oscillospiraceae bacterium]